MDLSQIGTELALVPCVAPAIALELEAENGEITMSLVKVLRCVGIQ